jgi:hypothetical protein
MPRILTTCPTTGEIVPTGHRSAELDLSAMIGTRAFRCPVCQQVHAWEAHAAYAEAIERRPGA